MNKIKKNFKFHLNGKTLALVDWANVYNWKKNINHQKLFKYLKSYDEIKQISFFFGEDKNEKSKNFLKECKKTGYKIISKKVKYLPIKKFPILTNINHILKFCKKNPQK